MKGFRLGENIRLRVLIIYNVLSLQDLSLFGTGYNEEDVLLSLENVEYTENFIAANAIVISGRIFAKRLKNNYNTFVCSYSVKNFNGLYFAAIGSINLKNMEKKMFGIILTILGVIGLVAAAVSFINAGKGSSNFKMIAVYGILGLIFFFTGIGLLKTTKDTSA